MSGDTSYCKLKTAALLRVARCYYIPFFFFFSLLPQNMNAQTKAKKETETTVSEKSRWAFRTNAVDWLLTIPNLAVEYDVSNSIYNKLTLNLGVRYNWHTSHNFVPATVFDLWEVRPEVRRYWRTEHRAQSGPKPSLTDQLFSKARTNPKFWRAYYIGVYTSFNGYSFKFGKEGFQGSSYGLGLSAGYSIPLYSYKNHFIDVEFGGSLGMSYAQYDVYEHDRENNSYAPVAAKSKGFHLVPFPVVSNVNVSFIYRFASIKDKYKQIDHAKIQARELQKITRKQFKDSLRTAHELSDSLGRIQLKFEKDSIRQVRLVTDSLKQLEKSAAKAEKRAKSASRKQPSAQAEKTKQEKSDQRKQSKKVAKQQAIRKEQDEKK